MGNFVGPRKKLSREDLTFLKENTHFTKRQIKQWYNGFIRDCPSGQLSKKKFIEVYSGFFPDGNAEKFCTHVFRTFDKDNSGRIDFKEFLLAINITSGGNPEEKLEWAYQMYDIDGNGTIERTEMVEIIRAIYSMLGTDNTAVDISPEARAEEIFEKMDENGDGVLTREEFMKGCMEDSQLKAMLLADDPVE
ncbi:Neuronal calcium sensor 2 [Schistosoma japonicum]|uniref:Neuronal calcium sensor 2 n=2 Tax=Schistosoma TaxID=6181 RepID=A0A4Z2CX01_SCHJA|nr:Neuronal calcium sensor 2 [Schistosoma japonicum]KAK4468195.1 hypothetical protein MN116_008097 [Schistosoma mekongi]TNN08768.1 Neuronal calcium sensor 2 [Schistosoma japonicum]TNN08769.1 Neuronal calcium sensor 2 [Schistosoma japonicum]